MQGVLSQKVAGRVSLNVTEEHMQAQAIVSAQNVKLSTTAGPGCNALKATGLLSCLQMKIISFRMKLK